MRNQALQSASGPRPLVTIPIAAYKSRPDHLAAAVESALTQTWREIEVVVSDDSPDDSLRSVVKSFDDPRAIYRHNLPKLGVAQNHWDCFRRANGEFIAVLNHDDLFSSAFLEKLVPQLIGDPALALAFCDHWIVDGDGRRLEDETDRASAHWGRTRLSEGAITPWFDLFAAQSIPMVMGAVFRRSLLPELLPEDAGPAYDLWLAYLLCREGRGAFYLPERLSSWRAHSGNLTSQNSIAGCLGTAGCWDTASRDSRLSSVRERTRSKAALAYYSCAVSAWRAGDRAGSFRYGWRSLLTQPTRKGLIACMLPAVPKRLVTRRATQ